MPLGRSEEHQEEGVDGTNHLLVCAVDVNLLGENIKTTEKNN
jgi:hypothetical protein